MAPDLVLTEEHAALRASVRGLLERGVDHTVRRDGEVQGFDRTVWEQVCAAGLTGLEVPTGHGGSGAGPVESWIVLEETGRALYEGPYLPVLLSTLALLGSEDDQACADLLPGLVSGSTVATLAVAGPEGDWYDHGEVMASPGEGGWSLQGARHFVVHGANADLLLVFAQAPRGPSLFAVVADDPRVEVLALESLDLTRPLATVRLHDAPARLVGVEGGLVDRVDHLRLRALAAQAAEQAGGAQWCLATSVRHAATREQFGRPIGSFQAVAHRCSEMLLQAELAGAAAQVAAATVVADPVAFPAAALVAAITATKAFVWTTAETVQVLGGTGFTWQHDAHLYFRRSRSAAQLFGAVDQHAAALAVLLGA